jgi:hypothetical protein
MKGYDKIQIKNYAYYQSVFAHTFHQCGLLAALVYHKTSQLCPVTMLVVAQVKLKVK